MTNFLVTQLYIPDSWRFSVIEKTLGNWAYPNRENEG